MPVIATSLTAISAAEPERHPTTSTLAFGQERFHSDLGVYRFEDQENIAGFDLAAGFDSHLRHHTVSGCVHMVFHLHCLKHDQGVAFGHGVTRLHSNIEHGARHRSYEPASWAAGSRRHEARDDGERLGAARYLHMKPINAFRYCRDGTHAIDFDVDFGFGPAMNNGTCRVPVLGGDDE